MLESCSEVKNARMNSDRDRLVGKMQVRQSKVHDKCNLSHGSALYHMNINSTFGQVSYIIW